MKKIGIYWNDTFVYNDGGINELSKVYTEGFLFEENKDYFLIKNPESVVLFGVKNLKNHPQTEKEVLFFYIPKSVITGVTYY